MRATQTPILYSSGLLYNSKYFRTPTVGIASFRCLIKFLSGMGDFGRVNAHQPRWKFFPGLRESDTHKRACLFCWKQSRKLLEESEWHCVFLAPYVTLVGNGNLHSQAFKYYPNISRTEKIFLRLRRNAYDFQLLLTLHI